jgi:LysM repeat protein
MRASLLLALLTLAPTEVVVREGESLAQVAQRTLGGPSGASELKALNGLKDDAVAPGTKLKLPGADRERAQNALEAARKTVKQVDAKATGLEAAVAKLKEAEVHFQNARYAEAAQAADETWKLLAMRPSTSPPATFTVHVGPEGTTKVESKSGPPVRVEAQGVTQSVQPGESLSLEKGQPPPPPRPALVPPQPSQPANKRKLSLKPAKGGLGPITLSWQAVEGAEKYEVVLVSAKGEKQVLSASHPQLKVTLPAAGAYRWSVQALTRDTRSEPSPEQGFEVAEVAEKAPANKSIKLQVQPSKWK